MKLFFARHGESQANVLHMVSSRTLPHSLTALGREQAFQLAEVLNKRHISHIFTSPIPRALETATIIASQFGLTPIPVDGLREYDCGILEGRTDEAAWELWHVNFEAWYLHQCYGEFLEGGEKFTAIRLRFMDFIQDLLSEFGNTNAEILFISHGGIYCLMLPLIVSNIDHDLIDRFGFDYTSCVQVDLLPDGLTCVEWNGQPVSAKNSAE